MTTATLHIAGLAVDLHEPEARLADLADVERDFDARATAYARDPTNPHLCFAGCSHCCKRGAFFAVTLVEALRLARAVEVLPEAMRAGARRDAEALLEVQRAEMQGDVPGRRDDRTFRAGVARVAARGPACPLLADDRCSVYANRPFLCRVYGYPVDAYAVESETALAFRSLCHLYAGRELHAYVQARDLRGALAELSQRLAGGRDAGRFTSAEAILAGVRGRR